MGFWTTCLPPAAAQYIFLECQLLTSYWALLETKVLTRPHLVLFCTQVPKMPWVRHASRQKFSSHWYLFGKMETVPSGEGETWPQSLFQITEGCGLQHAQSLAWEPCGTGSSAPLPPPQATWEAPWDQLSEMHRELLSFISSSATTVRDAAHGRVMAFYPASGTSLLRRVLPAQPNWRNS